MKEVCLVFKHSNEAVVFKVGNNFGEGIAKQITRDGDSIVITDEDGEERVFPDPNIVWYVEDAAIEIIQ